MTSRQLEGAHLTRLFPQVFVLREHVMTDADWIHGATLAMPARAQLSHVSRIHHAGLDIGQVLPVHFTVAGDLHLAVENIVLHRTEVLPPVDDVGVTPAAAFIQYCAGATVIDAVKVGDWLLHHRLMTETEVAGLARLHRWRPGAGQALWVMPLLDPGSMSVKESEVRVRIEAAGLPRPEVGVRFEAEGELLGVVDLLMRCVMLVLEYEGRHHAESTRQFSRDIRRYASFRRHGLDYLQITHEMTTRPMVMVRRVHARMVELGYVGPDPVFGRRWEALSASIPRPKHSWR